MAFVPPPVSRWYRYDWQFAVDVSRLPILRQASIIISLMPLIFPASSALLRPATESPLSLSLLWWASAFFMVAWLLLYLFCPRFIREYRDFGQFKARQHSHRWIVWEFYNNLESLSGWESIVRETSSKRLTTRIEELPPELVKNLGTEFAAPAAQGLKVFTPVNVDRDIYLPMLHDGSQLVLALKEDDPKLNEKEKELFWILYTRAVKERPAVRGLYWALVGASAVLLAANVIKLFYFAYLPLSS